MPTTTKRSPARGGAPAASSSSSSSPVINLMILAAALIYGFWLLLLRGRVSWPPNELLGSLYTVAGCLALVGPILLWRRESSGGGLGELIWLTGGLLIWVFDLAALVRGEVASHSWTTPMPAASMGLTILAVGVAGWRLRPSGGSSWSWTNVTGWILGVFWVAMGAFTLLPQSLVNLAKQ